MKRILQLDGGGVKGVAQMAVLKEIEGVIGKPICEIFDLIIGTSVGAITGGMLATGRISAKKLFHEALDIIPQVFKPRLRIPLLQPKYDRKLLSELITRYGGYMNMNTCKTKFVSTSVNIVDGRTHFFKSWEEKDGKKTLTNIINRSYAAPMFFGAIDEDKGVWIDGGCGNMNCTLDIAMVEAVRQGWLPNQRVHVLSLGSGFHNDGIPYEKARKYKNGRQLMVFFDPGDGGLARTQVNNTKSLLANYLIQANPNFSCQRLDTLLTAKKDGLDKTEYLSDYVKMGLQWTMSINYDFLKDNL